jgi:hypothetical protein
MSQNATDRAVDCDATLPSTDEVDEGSLVGCAGEPQSSSETRDGVQIVISVSDRFFPERLLRMTVSEYLQDTRRQLAAWEHEVPTEDESELEIREGLMRSPSGEALGEPALYREAATVPRGTSPEGSFPPESYRSPSPDKSRLVNCSDRFTQQWENMQDAEFDRHTMQRGVLIKDIVDARARTEEDDWKAQAAAESGMSVREDFEERFGLLKKRCVYPKTYRVVYLRDDHPSLTDNQRAQRNFGLKAGDLLDELMFAVYTVWLAVMRGDDERTSMKYKIYFLAYLMLWEAKDKICKSLTTDHVEYLDLEDLVKDKYNVAYAAVSLAVTQYLGLPGYESKYATESIMGHFQKKLNWTLNLKAWKSMQIKILKAIDYRVMMSSPYDYIKLCADFSGLEAEKKKETIDFASHLCVMFMACTYNFRESLDQTSISTGRVVDGEIVTNPNMLFSWTHEHPLKLGLAAFNAALFYCGDVPERMASYVVTSMCVPYANMPGCCGCGKMSEDIYKMSAKMCENGFKLHIGSHIKEINLSDVDCDVINGMLRDPLVRKKTLLSKTLHEQVPMRYELTGRLVFPKFGDLFLNRKDTTLPIVKRVRHNRRNPVYYEDMDMMGCMVFDEKLKDVSRDIIRRLYETAECMLSSADARAPDSPPRAYKRIRPTEDSDTDTAPEPRRPVLKRMKMPEDPEIEELERPVLEFRRKRLDAILAQSGLAPAQASSAEEAEVDPEAPTPSPPAPVSVPVTAPATQAKPASPPEPASCGKFDDW